MDDLLILIGRALLSLIFLSSGVAHLTKTNAMAGYVASKGLSRPKLLVQISGVVILLGGIFMLTGIQVELGALMLSGFCFLAAILMHPFWKETDGMTKMNEQTAFLKDLALAGATLAIYALYAG